MENQTLNSNQDKTQLQLHPQTQVDGNKVLKVPSEIVDIASKSRYDISKIYDIVSYKYPELELSRNDVRKVVSLVVEEEEKDLLAAAPKDSMGLRKIADLGIFRQIQRLVRYQEKLIEAADTEGDLVLLDNDDIPVSKSEIRSRLSRIASELGKLKKEIMYGEVDENKDNNDSKISMNVYINNAIESIKKQTENGKVNGDIIDVENIDVENIEDKERDPLFS